MTSVRHDGDTVPLPDAVAELFDRLHIADLQLRLRMMAWRDGFAAGERAHADDYDRGYAAALADLKRTEHELVRTLTLPRGRWTVRDQRRTRDTFADPHPGDYPGRGGA